MSQFNPKTFKAVLLLIALLFAIAGFSQDKNAFTLQIDSFYAKIKEQKNPQIIDARSPEEFAINHINGAVNFNLETKNYIQYVAKLDKSKPVFIYSIGAGRSGQLANELLKNGFSDVHDLDGGIAAWIGGGKPFYSNTKNKLSQAEYQKIVTSNNTVLVDIGSRYCGACKKVKPVLETIRAQYGEDVKIVEIDLEDNPQIIADLKTVKVFPTLILYRKGKIFFKKDGGQDLKKDVDLALASN
ncbi:thioredoxin domain-containing protein [Flavobacterium gilvum]|uniref:Sulfurtransferase n=1 Tax=Flavobacterium gilvum TaxID=1492737 RepID=A0AAC9I5P7_9FLAO|nr:thioredoxin domain-containing protein [Flavobacterium gilvum]AOW09333.1 sulfurtransferase [Flavobacterium gilvum]KFC58947.1 sulfurtransferase [Flavobacterium gilvum]